VKSAKDFLDLLMVSSLIQRINEDVVKIDDYTDIQHVSEGDS
jgi:hypothetical protein